MTKQTRLKITIGLGVYLCAIGVLSIFEGLENATIAVITALSGSIMAYIWGETKRPS